MEESDEVLRNNNDADDNCTNQTSEKPAVPVLVEGKITPVTNSDAAEEAKAAAINHIDSSKSKEEGELSSSDDDDVDSHATEPAYRFANCDTAQVESAQASPIIKTLPNNKGEQCGPTVKPVSMVGVSSRASQQSDHLKGSEKNREPFVPFVISFSDEDTGSDSEDSRRNTLVTKHNKQGVDRNRKPPVLSVQKSQKLQQNTTKKTSLINRESSLSRSYVSSVAKIDGATSWNSGQLPNIRNFSILQRGAGQNHGPGRKTNVHLNSNKRQLQDLRQLIAIRESELKHKSRLQTKKPLAGLSRDGKIRNPSNLGDRVRKASGFDGQSDLNEPDKKRLKIGGLQSGQLDSDCHNNLCSLQPMLTSGKSRLDDCGIENIDDHSHCDKRVPFGTSLSSHSGVQEQAETRDSLASANPPSFANEGNNTVGNSIQSARNADPVLKETGRMQKRAVEDFPSKLSKVDSGHMEYTHRDVAMSIQNRVAFGINLIERDKNQVKSSDKVSERKLEDRVQPAIFHVFDRNPEKAPLGNPSFPNALEKINMTGNSSMDLQSLLDFEELQDKEIEEAQEHRRKCEIEERNALMAYRKAQRALIEANARCSHLYSKRELYSAQLSSLMMENPNMIFSTRRHDQIEAGLNSYNNISDVNGHPIPTYRHQVQTASDVKYSFGCDTNVPSANDDSQNLSNSHMRGQNLVSDPCCEPGGSPSEGHKQHVSNGICSPSGDLSRSSYEDGEIFEFDHKCAQDNLESERTSEFIGASEKDIYEESERQVPLDSSQDCLLLEASLRSQLFEKLKTKKFSNRVTTHSTEHLVERRAENDDSGKMMQTDAEHARVFEIENDKNSDFDVDNKDERCCEIGVQIDNQFDISHPEHAPPSTDVPMDSCFGLEGQQSTRSGTFFLPAMKSAFSHLGDRELLVVLQSQTTSSDILISDVDLENDDSNVLNKSKPIIWSLDMNEPTAMDSFVGQSGYYSCNLAIDPFWPLCMYELRGKCNNDECSWQHVKDYSCDSMKHDTTDKCDVQVRTSYKDQFYGATPLRKSLDHLILAPPTYVVGLDILRLDSQSCISASPLGYGQCWGKCFSSFLVLSSLCPMVTQSNEPFLHGTEARIEVHSNWNRQSSYFHSRNATLSQLDQCSADVDQSVEMALLNFIQEADKDKARIEALKVLVRAIEDNPTSVVLWIVYLLIFYSNQKSIGKDDLFQYAVEYNKESYELWLLYINSRVQLDDQLAAYDMALSALSNPSSTSALHASECILDLFLQKMNCLCMSGNVARATEIISGLFLSTKTPDDHLQLSFHDTVACLTICDKFIFWVCCVYLLVYKKLPDPVVQRFEFWKESSAIEWPSICLRLDEKQQAASLLEMAVDSLASFMDHESLENEKTLRAAHLFALNHVRCVSVLEGLECSRNLLEKYITLYPSCLELVLTSARAEYDSGGWSFRGFEEALRNWPDQVPGVHCIWNQYIGCVLQNGKLDFVKELMDRWFYSVLEARDSDNGVLRTEDGNADSSIKSISVSDLHAWFSNFGQNDCVFGMLNLSLYKLLQNDYAEARFALELALKAATADNYQHCLRELVPFLLTDSIQHKGNVHLKGMLNILNVHLVDTRASLASEPLSRDFLQKIKKPRVRQLVSKLLSPVSADFSLMNMILEVWYGRTLLPHLFDKQREFLNFVEAIMEILPSNYLLALSVCKLLSESGNALKLTASISFWASSLLVNALFHAVPVAPEYIWVEAADILHNLTDIWTIQESFHHKALLVYPFSIKLWKSYLHLSKTEGKVESVKEAAKGKGIELD
ncbi:hypothetical protein ACH5RR_016624 [Cinchona calisaya]|uniref:Putative zinc-finger domain-containing protein n=1 Tax=Cinchona calisaya TaxID=153742 RepID=A0ABD2ZWE2_9GENT